jgi:D-amino-acid oxidase
MTLPDDDQSHPLISRRTFLAGAVAAGAVGFAGCEKIVPGSDAGVAAEIRKITPPRLAGANLGKHILCYRPMRKGAPKMSAAVSDGRLVAHNYGHGGSGWTLGPGTVQHVVGLAEAEGLGTTYPKDEPITVLGAGVMGLFTAYDLLTRGYSRVTVTAASFEDLTSHNAGGLLAPVSMDNAPEMQALIDKVGVDAYRFYAQVARGEHPHFAQGAKIVPSYFETREESGLEPYVGVAMAPAKEVTLDFGNGTTRAMVAYDDGIFIDTATMMHALTEYLKSRTTFEQRKVDSLGELESRVVFDCSGLGAGKLNADSEMVPVQGHLIMLKDQVPEDLQYMILVYFNKDHTESGQTVKRSLYVFPKHLPDTGASDVGVVGGTFIEGGTPDTPNTVEFDIMMAGARRFYGIV